MERVEVLFTEKEVDDRIAEIGRQISEDYKGKSVHLICILKGSAPFMCELAKRIDCTVSFDFMSVSSYGKSKVSSGHVEIKKDLDESIEGKDVIVIEDIIDTGRTLSELLKMLSRRKAASIKLCTLLDKPDGRDKTIENEVKVDYVGFVIPDEFVVGYGLDYDQRYRNLPYIGIVKED